MERAVVKAWREFSGACARPPRWANKIGSEDHSAVADTGLVCRSAGLVDHTSTRRIVIVDGGWFLVALGFVLAVVATSHLNARLGRLSMAVGYLARTADRYGVDVARVGRR